jgi:hypothetical protein
MRVVHEGADKAADTGRGDMPEITLREPSKQNYGHLALDVVSYWAFLDEKKIGEDDDIAIYRIIRERKFFKMWATVLAWANLLALLILAVMGA